MTTLSSLPIGAKVKVPHSVMGNVIFLKADQNHEGYPENSTTLITEEIILLRTFDAKEPNNTNPDRQKYGNNRYSVSNIDQWLNSTASAGQWYSPQHDTDQSPNSTSVVSQNPYDTDAGFLNGFDARFIDAMQDTTITGSAKPYLFTVTDSDITSDKFVLLYPLDETTETWLNENSLSSIITEASGKFTFKVAVNTLPSTYSMKYFIQ